MARINAVKEMPFADVKDLFAQHQLPKGFEKTLLASLVEEGTLDTRLDLYGHPIYSLRHDRETPADPLKALDDAFAEVRDARMAALRDVLDGKYGTAQKLIGITGIQVTEMLLRKNRDYGGSAHKRPVLAPWLDPGTAILVRMSDKIERIRRLGRNEAAHVEEALDDTMRDLAGYAILWLAADDTSEDTDR